MLKLHQMWKLADKSNVQIYFCFEDFIYRRLCVPDLERHDLRGPGYRNSDEREHTIELCIEESALNMDTGETLGKAIKGV